MTEAFTIEVKQYDRSDPRLGRNVRHDSRSLRYQVEAAPLSSLQSVQYPHYIPVLNQGPLGSCTGNAGTGNLACGVFWSTIQSLNLLSASDALVDEQYAVNLYSDATKIDPYSGDYPPDDTGSDGLSIAQVLKARGLISGYQHATSLEAALTALSQQPVIVGTEWLEDMFNPAPDGHLVVSGQVAGGHEYLLDELDVANQRVGLRNSWGSSWGLGGRAYLSWDDLGTLLDAQGDCTVFTPISAPAPTPTPTPITDPLTDYVNAGKRLCRKLNAYLRSVSSTTDVDEN